MVDQYQKTLVWTYRSLSMVRLMLGVLLCGWLVLGAPPAALATPTAALSMPERKGQIADVTKAPFNARGDGRADDTLAIQKAIDSHYRVYVPAGVYLIDPKIGLKVRTGTTISGDGRVATVLLAKPGGASIDGHAGYVPAAVIRRDFEPSAANDYVSFVRLSDFSIILSHPQNQVTMKQIQIGVDLRNITRSHIRRLHIGNIPIPSSRPVKTRGYRYDSQGYGVVLGTVPSSFASYAGGELNTIEQVSIWGAYKAIAQDDRNLSPRSAAHATKLVNNDLQSAHTLISQESRYTRSSVWSDNTLQNIVPQPGAKMPTAAFAMEGQDSVIQGGYIEVGSASGILLSLGRSSKNIRVQLGYVSCRTPLKISDLGTTNDIRYDSECEILSD